MGRSLPLLITSDVYIDRYSQFPSNSHRCDHVQQSFRHRHGRQDGKTCIVSGCQSTPGLHSTLGDDPDALSLMFRNQLLSAFSAFLTTSSRLAGRKERVSCRRQRVPAQSPAAGVGRRPLAVIRELRS